MSMFKWDVVAPGPGEAVAPHQRLAWGKTVGLGAQHVVAMFGATFVFPIIMGLNANLAIMMSGIATICFLLIVNGAVPSYLGTSASFVGGATAIYTYSGSGGPGGPADVTGAILVSGVVLALVGVLVHYAGADIVNRILPPVVTGGVVMVIGFNLAGVATSIYMPADRRMANITMTDVVLMAGGLRGFFCHIAILTMTAVVLMAVGLRGFFGRIAIFLGLIFGYLLSWIFDAIGVGGVDGDRVNWDAVKAADWLGFPRHTADGLVGNQNEAGHLDLVGWHAPSFSLTFALLALPAVI